MTPEERAEKVRQILIDCREGKLDEAVALIDAEIADACRAAVEEAKAYKLSYWQQRMNEAKAEAYEDAAKLMREVCEAPTCENRCYHEHAIRARAKQVNGK